ncbi:MULTISPECIES: GTP cyclohydrolase FolE2 [Pseudomonas syringae group]|uniref:GTP cyclohydrolase FolE2 n=1 Tax=Pseudomonas syringae group TaxID=136849 RepID=UPI0006D60AFC|nr:MULTISPECIES: GTP cyclohydrolase FolE2 [Pseudomonas syringae group]KPX34241.1 GTP cyclohydrolase FolE2 [Pseudomonas coronafaciens pv. garcae]MCQ3026520.1 GTP cyclohydrolase FolE2 [Pseudomonas tremae]RMS95940.1 GTP cyclohydrolase FolE2 [Pseudomonas coronafaciens pv. oryzae]RMS99441.1 GTP cyclohydrolase FolE2 [Pseudomonas coronafaciens pv. oryzae]RMV90733.1 GTP cyclohydrolase FolE2 [Pseudomonas coronafaciens pv. garcae]
MNNPLPDVALTEVSSALISLDWVGMQGVEVPIRLAEAGIRHPVHAHVDLQVDLADPSVKGIHMSRLYRLLDRYAEHQILSPDTLAALMEAMVESHLDCHSSRSRLTLSFNLLCRRPALITEGLSGWKSYPVKLDATWHAGHLCLDVSADITYSSTCPCSAALSRQLLEEAFTMRFGRQSFVDPMVVAAWLRENASHATPHSQRSVATVQVRVAEQAAELGLMSLIDAVEQALGTPVQTAVKRADEQAFARLNGQNLMYVEDAARKIQQALEGRYAASSVSVRHFESLHPHDAAAQTSNYLS